MADQRGYKKPKNSGQDSEAGAITNLTVSSIGLDLDAVIALQPCGMDAGVFVCVKGCAYYVCVCVKTYVKAFARRIICV